MSGRRQGLELLGESRNLQIMTMEKKRQSHTSCCSSRRLSRRRRIATTTIMMRTNSITRPTPPMTPASRATVEADEDLEGCTQVYEPIVLRQSSSPQLDESAHSSTSTHSERMEPSLSNSYPSPQATRRRHALSRKIKFDPAQAVMGAQPEQELLPEPTYSMLAPAYSRVFSATRALIAVPFKIKDCRLQHDCSRAADDVTVCVKFT